jgi:hypothetical protein
MQYIDWQEFQFWVRSILEVEDRIPEWLVKILGERCPGFVDSEGSVSERHAQGKPLALRLEDWIEGHIFALSKEQGWLNAVTFYAMRDPRYQRAEVCWSESVAQWKKVKPARYPTFEEWKLRGETCDDTTNLTPEIRRMRKKAKLVSRDQLLAAVADYMDWEAFAYWARAALESGEDLPAMVAQELQVRCPGYLEVRRIQGDRCSGREWEQLMGWIVDHYFQAATAEGWFAAVLLEAQNHPRAIRTKEYADHCDEIGGSCPSTEYPALVDWRNAADSYVEESGSDT